MSKIDLNRLKVTFNEGWEPEFVEHLRIERTKGVWWMEILQRGCVDRGEVTFWAKDSVFIVESKNGKPIKFDFDGHLPNQVEELESHGITKVKVCIEKSSVGIEYGVQTYLMCRVFTNVPVNLY